MVGGGRSGWNVCVSSELFRRWTSPDEMDISRRDGHLLRWTSPEMVIFITEMVNSSPEMDISRDGHLQSQMDQIRTRCGHTLTFVLATIRASSPSPCSAHDA